MEGMRLLRSTSIDPLAPCCRCDIVGCPWDRIDDEPFCPDCQEGLILGTVEPIKRPLTSGNCALCRHPGVLRFTTFPLKRDICLEVDLCAPHLHALLARRLPVSAILQFEMRLALLGSNNQEIFLLHEAFYDEEGQPLQPVHESM